MKSNILLAIAASTILCSLGGISAFPLSLESRQTSPNKVIVGYFPNWLYGRFPPANINFNIYTHIYYAFAIQNSDGVPTWSDSGVFDDYVAYGFPKLVSLAHQAGTKVIVSVGGWSGSTSFSTMSSSSSRRAEWIKWNIEFIKTWETDGVDIDWEYPNSKGAGCNIVSPNDVDNLNILVKELREALNSEFPNDYKEITMAVHITPFGGVTPVTDVSGFVPYIDRFQIMSFDVNGAWNSTSGPNAPFHNQPGFGYAAGFVEGIESWKAAGVPYSKISAGIPFYGRSQTLLKEPTSQYTEAVSPSPPLGDSLDGPWQNTYCSSDTSVASGIWRWSHLRSQGILTSPTSAASSWTRHFDNVTQTPWLYNPSTRQFISYDDPESLAVKTEYAIQKGLAGFFVWSVDQDNGELLKAIAPIISGNSKGTPMNSNVSVTHASVVPNIANNTHPVATAVLAHTSPTANASVTNEVKASIKPDDSNSCNSYLAWSESTVYLEGDIVSSDGNIYKAQWWTLSELPTKSKTWSSWLWVSAC